MTHYYDLNGNPKYEIVGKNGKARMPYAKEAKELGLAPGSTSIIDQLNKSALIEWIKSSIINLCRDNPFCAMGQSDQDWKTKILLEFKKESERITSQGHKIHDAFEVYYKTGTIKEKYKAFIQPVIEYIEMLFPSVKREQWISEQSFNYRGLYGGKVDLHCPLMGGIIIDFKTKDTDDVSKFKAYENHRQQLISYAYGLKLPKAKLFNVFISALKPGIFCVEEHSDIEKNNISWQKFDLLVKYWHLENYKELPIVN